IQLQSGCLQGLKLVRHAQAPFQVIRPALFAIGLVLTASLLRSSFRPQHAVLLQFFATGAALMVTIWSLRGETPREAVHALPIYRTMEWVRASAHFVAISIAQLVLSTQ